MSYEVIHGDCRDAMELIIPSNSVDAIVTDPPYGLGFMGKEWDHGVPGKPFWKGALEVAKPGAYLLAFGGTRTYHRLACAIEDAGWELRDCIMWVYGSGFPKSHNLDGDRQGWGTALKPAWEPIIVARKPLEGTVAANVLQHGTGALHIDACRVSAGEVNSTRTRTGEPSADRSYSGQGGTNFAMKPGARGGDSRGRWPANLIHDGDDEVIALFPSEAGAAAAVKGTEQSAASVGRVTGFRNRVEGAFHADTGSAARFFYCAKASKSDRDDGCEGLPDRVLAMSNQAKAELARGDLHSADSGMNTGKVRKNNHPTVKPTDLMRYLCRLVTPPGGTVLDPFNGSGSTGKGAILEGFNYIGCETELEYIGISNARLAKAAA